MAEEITYGKTPIGQLIYDLGFTKLADRYLARKHKLTIVDVRKYRELVKNGLKQGAKAARKKRARP